MKRYNYAIQVADNVTDIMNLPCVMRCDKLMFCSDKKNAVQYRYLLDDGQEAVTYDWIVQDLSGKWHVLSGAQYEKLNEMDTTNI